MEWVWVLQECFPYEGCWLQGVFSTEAKAEEGAERLGIRPGDYMITPKVLDEVNDGTTDPGA